MTVRLPVWYIEVKLGEKFKYMPKQVVFILKISKFGAISVSRWVLQSYFLNRS